MSSGPRPPHRPADLMTAAMTRPLKLGRRRNKITIDRGLAVPMRDGTILLADHYAPVTGRPRPTVLMRCPYGRGWQFAVLARPFAERGYHVLLQSARGTFGSGGVFTPGRDEAADGLDTVAWLRTQEWFNGRLVTVGASYLAFAGWALALEPPPELTAMAAYISPHDLAAAGFGHGPFELFNLLLWSDLMAHQEQMGPTRMIWRTTTADKRLAAALNRLPIAATGASISDVGAPWYAEWLAHPDGGDPYWAGYSAAPALERVAVPTLLISGFHDFFVEQTVQQYHALHRRGIPVGLTIGPWTHMTIDMGLALRETFAWLDAYADGNADAPSPRPYAVRVWTSGVNKWRELPDWPPPGSTPQAWYLHPGGVLGNQQPECAKGNLQPDGAEGNLQPDGANTSAGAATAFRYDPAEPTPSVGGRIMSMRNGGCRENSAVEARSDVLTFTSPPLDSALEVAGVPVVRLYLSSDNAHCDIFARLCDVDSRGRSRNLTDQIIRSDPAKVRPGEVREVSITLTDVSHVFLAGHRIRLQVSGGAHPRFARNLGTPADPLTGTEMAAANHQVQHSRQLPSAVLLPVLRQPQPRWQPRPEPTRHMRARRRRARASHSAATPD